MRFAPTLSNTRYTHTVEWFSLMGAKKKNRPAGATTKSKGKSSRPKSSRPKSRPARRKAPARKRKPEPEILPVLIADKLKELYVTMVKCRMLAERVQNPRPSARQTHHSFLGLEAMLVGAGAHLLPQDCFALEHSSFVASLIKGTPLQSVLAKTRTAENGNTGASLPSSVQTAGNSKTLTMTAILQLAETAKGSGAVTLMCCTQDPVSLIFESDAMAHAATRKLPMVCLVESSLDSRLQLPGQPSGPYVGADPAFYPNIPVDGNDVVAVFRVIQEAIRRAREGHGPAVIECITSRASAAQQLSGKEATARHIAQDPLKFMEDYLRRKNLWTDEWSRSLVATFGRELDEAFASVEKIRDLAGDFDNVYSADSRADSTAAASPEQAAVRTT